MLLGITCRKCLTYRWTVLIACTVSITLLAIVFHIFPTGTLLNFLLGRRLSLTSLTDHTVGQTVLDSNVTGFRGRLIKSSDQLADVDMNSIRCVKANIGGMRFPVCVHEATTDIWVSKSFTVGGYWERPSVDRFIRLLRRYPDLEFVDLGANIGTFTLPVARITHVVAVEPYSRS